jgi:hypothetical protein
MIEWYVGFYRPYLRDTEGRLSVRGLLGHCDIWGYNDDGTWLFIDPQSHGTRVLVAHAYDEVQAQLSARFALCDSILRLPADPPEFRFPLFGLMTCAAICGHITGVRALLPWGLHRKLLAKGAKVVHGQEAEGRSERQEGPAP